MMTYYVATRPETVVAVVTIGKLPNTLPSWLKVSYLVCTQAITHCFDENTTSNHQTFVLELDFPKQNSSQEEFCFLENIDPNTIKRIFVYSQRSMNLLNKLFAGNCPKKIIMQPNIYPKVPEQSKKRPQPESSKEEQSETAPSILPLAKRAALFSSSTINHSLEKKDCETTVNRLSTYAEHLELLQFALKTAKKTVLITSFNVNHETLLKANLYNLIPAARRRGVKIYIYYNDKNYLNKQIANFFRGQGVSCQESFSHSKILAVDDNLAATGSI